MQFKQIKVNLGIYLVPPSGLSAHRKKTGGIKMNKKTRTIKIPCFQKDNTTPAMCLHHILGMASSFEVKHLHPIHNIHLETIKETPILLPKVMVASQGKSTFVWIRINLDIIRVVQELRGGR
jgi:hypothetical protein